MSIKLSIYDGCLYFIHLPYLLTLHSVLCTTHVLIPLLSINVMPCAISKVTYIQRDPRSHKLAYAEPPRAVCLCMCSSHRRKYTFYYIVCKLGPYRPTKLYIRNQSGRRFQASNILAVSAVSHSYLTRNARGAEPVRALAVKHAASISFLSSCFYSPASHIIYVCFRTNICLCCVCCECVQHRTTHE